MADEFTESFNKLFENLFGESSSKNLASFPRTNVVENSGCMEIFLEVPGFEKEDIVIKVLSGQVLEVRGARTLKKTTFYKQQFQETSVFSKKFKLGSRYDIFHANAKCKAGILNITVPVCLTGPSEVKVN